MHFCSFCFYGRRSVAFWIYHFQLFMPIRLIKEISKAMLHLIRPLTAEATFQSQTSPRVALVDKLTMGLAFVSTLPITTVPNLPTYLQSVRWTLGQLEATVTADRP
jgi:hypothetical protein